MIRALLVDLHDTHLENDVARFIPAYFGRGRQSSRGRRCPRLGKGFEAIRLHPGQALR